MVGWKITVWIGVVLVAIWFLYLVRGILLPFAIAFLISILLDPTIRKLRLKGYKRLTAVSLVFVAFFAVMTGLGFLLVPSMNSQLSSFRDQFQSLTQQLSEENANDNFFLRWNPAVQAQPQGTTGKIDRFLESNQATLERFGLPTTRRAIMEQYVEPHREDIAGVVQNFFNSFLGLVGTAASQMLFLLFTPLFAFMMLMDFEQFKVRSQSWIPPSIRAETISILRDVGEVFVKYLRGVTITVLTYMAVMAAVLTILGAPYAILLAVLAGVFYMIPIVGALMSAVTLFLLTGLSGQSGNWFLAFDSSWYYALFVVVCFYAISFSFDQFVYPNLVGQALGLHPLVSMFVIFSGGALFGLVGMIIAFPLAGTVKIILERVLKVTSGSSSADLKLPVVPLRHRSASEV
ncbi:MAG TPA: AI-2E family transporter [Fimbriimonadaceae bacterium]|nr:AI-2E family transporter [Fimbriimonadaceae bacterium]